MTKAEEIRTGERVRATHRDTGDVSEFKAESIYSGGVASRDHSFSDVRWEFEIIQAPIPTEPGLYFIADGLKYLSLTTYGRWYWTDFTSPDFTPFEAGKHEVERQAYRLTLVHKYEGRD